MLKRWLSFLLAMVLVLGLCSCDRLPNIDLIPDKTTKTTATTGTPAGTDPTDPRYILIVGNSHSVDAFWLLYQAYMDQYPGTDLCVGILHYGGACIDEHVKFAENKDEVIRYYRNNSGKWDIQYGVTTEFVLKDQPWDTILMQPAKEDLADDTLNKKGRHALVAQFTGKPIQEVGINRITVGWRHKQNKEFGPLDLTDEMKQGIIRGANYALKSPWELPKK